MPGVSNENIEILSPPSIRKGKNAGEYIMVGEKGRNGKVSIKVRDKLSGIVSPDVIFDVIRLPKPLALFSGNSSRLSAQQIASGRLTGSFNNERLDNGLKLNVAEFKVRVGLRNLGVVRNTGGSFNDRIKQQILRARRGETVTVYDIKVNSAKIDNGTRFLTPQNDIVLTVR